MEEEEQGLDFVPAPPPGPPPNYAFKTGNSNSLTVEEFGLPNSSASSYENGFARTTHWKQEMTGPPPGLDADDAIQPPPGLVSDADADQGHPQRERRNSLTDKLSRMGNLSELKNKIKAVRRIRTSSSSTAGSTQTGPARMLLNPPPPSQMDITPAPPPEPPPAILPPTKAIIPIPPPSPPPSNDDFVDSIGSGQPPPPPGPPPPGLSDEEEQDDDDEPPRPLLPPSYPEETGFVLRSNRNGMSEKNKEPTAVIQGRSIESLPEEAHPGQSPPLDSFVLVQDNEPVTWQARAVPQDFVLLEESGPVPFPPFPQPPSEKLDTRVFDDENVDPFSIYPYPPPDRPPPSLEDDDVIMEPPQHPPPEYFKYIYPPELEWENRLQKPNMPSKPQSPPPRLDERQTIKELVNVLRREWTRSNSVILPRRVRNAFQTRDKKERGKVKKYEFQSALIEATGSEFTPRCMQEIERILAVGDGFEDEFIPYELFLKAAEALSQELRKGAHAGDTEKRKHKGKLRRRTEITSTLQRKLEQYSRWINSFPFIAQSRNPLTAESICERLKSGSLLCRIVEYLVRVFRDKHSFSIRGVTSRVHSKAVALKNLELALEVVWKQKIVARNMPSAEQLYDADPNAVCNLMGELVSAFLINRQNLYAPHGNNGLVSIFLWYSFVIEHFYETGLPSQLLRPPHRGIWAAFGGVDPIMCTLFFFEGSRVVDLSRIYRHPVQAVEVQANAVELIRVLETLKLPVTLTADEFVAARPSDQDMLLVLLVSIFERYKSSKCGLPTRPIPGYKQYVGEVEDLNLSEVSGSPAGFASDEAKKKKMVYGVMFRERINRSRAYPLSPDRASPPPPPPPPAEDDGEEDYVDGKENSPIRTSPKYHERRQKQLAKDLGLAQFHDRMEASVTIPRINYALEIAKRETKLMEIEEARSWARMSLLESKRSPAQLGLDRGNTCSRNTAKLDKDEDTRFNWLFRPRLFSLIERNSSTLCEFMIHKHPHDAILAWTSISPQDRPTMDGFIRMSDIQAVELEKRTTVFQEANSSPALIVVIKLYPGSFSAVQSSNGRKTIAIKASASNHGDSMRLYAQLVKLRG